MGFAIQEKHCVSNGNLTKRIVNIVHSLNAFNSSMSDGNNALLNHFRSWQRSRKMKMLNKNSHSYVGHRSPMNNLCYQSVSINDLESKTESNDCYITADQTRMKTKSNPIVSFMNKGDGKIALNLKNQPVILNENQLYSMDIIPKAELNLNDKELKRASSDFSCYASLEPPPNEHEIILQNDPLSDETWYYGSINREQAIKLIHNCPTGSFVVRKSSSKDGCYALTVRVPYDYNHTGVSHYLILQTDEKFKIKGFQKEFHTLSSLITHHSIMKEQLPCTLRLIMHKFSSTSTLLSNNSTTATYNNDKNQQKFQSLNSSHQIYNKFKQSINGYSGYNTYRPNGNFTSRNNNNNNIICNDDRMVDIDLDPTYQRILENFRKAMAHCN